VPFAGSISRSGVEGGDGLITVFLGAAIAIVGGALASGRSASGIARSWVPIALLGVVTLALDIVEYNNVQDRISGLDSSFRDLATVGIGIWIIGLGAVMAAIGGFSLRGRFSRGPKS
jgi:hypothetical protein